MLRGVISINPKQISYLVNQAEFGDAMLLQKLSRLTNASESVLVEVNEDQVEMMLDLLPPPGEDELTTELRQVLSQFLGQLRQ